MNAYDVDGAIATGHHPNPGPSRFAQLRDRAAQWVFVDPSPLVKQSPFFLFYLAAALILLFLPTFAVASSAALTTGLLVVLAATVFAATLGSRPELLKYAPMVPAVDFLALGLLRLAAGEHASVFGSLALLAIVWLASEPGRRFVAYAAVGATASLLLPQVLGPGLSMHDASEVVRTVFSPFVFGVAAGVVNELSRLARDRLASVRQRELAVVEEMNKAAVVQRALLPKSSDTFSGYNMAGVCVPSKSVGGDFYDWYPIPGGLTMTLGDVMGKGAGAGLVAAAARAVVRDATDEPNDEFALRRMALRLRRELLDADTFMTFFHARVHSESGAVTYADAGHGLSFIIRTDGTYERLTSVDFPLGIGPEGRWLLQRAVLEPGDMMVSVSDGVLDLYDGSLSALDAVVALSRDATSARELVGALALLARDHVNPDDVTMVVMQRDLVSTQPDGPLFSAARGATVTSQA